MIILFAREVKYKAEIIAAQRAGFKCLFFSLSGFLKKGVNELKEILPVYEKPEWAILRGMVISPLIFDVLYNHLGKEHNLWLINSPTDYLETCSVVNHFPKIAALASPTTWISELSSPEQITKQLADTFAPGTPLMIKDFMRSAKYEREQVWDIEDSSNSSQVAQAIRKLIAAKGGMLEGGIVFSKYLAFHQLHPAPLPFTEQKIYEEYRLWFFKGELLLKTGYFEEMPDYAKKLTESELEPLKAIAKTICSNFFVMDVARKKADNTLCIVELNPGQTSGINYHHHHKFYQLLYNNSRTVSWKSQLPNNTPSNH